MALTAVAIKNAKGLDKAYKLTDGDGLFLYVTPSGGRYWRMNYRHLGKQKTLAFGVYPDTSLAEARERRDAARKALARGDDPGKQITLERIAAAVVASNSFKAVADEWLKKVELEGRSPVTMKKLRWLLDFINASIGKRPIASISAQELLAMLRKMEGKGKYETAKRLRSTCSQVFRYAIATARADRDIAADLRGALIAPQPVHRAAITSATQPEGCCGRSRCLKGTRTPKWRFACCRIYSCARANYVMPNGPTSISTRRFGPSRRTKPRCAVPTPSRFRGRRSALSEPSSTTQTIAASYSPRCVQWSGPCRKTRSTQPCAAWAMLRTR